MTRPQGRLRPRPTPEPPCAGAERAAQAAKLRKGYLALVQRAAIVAAVFWLVFAQVLLLARVQGNEMFPVAKDGDLLLAFRLQQQYTKNDVVVYRAEDALHIGRVVACGGDVVNIQPEGTLLVNGTPQSGEILYPTYPDDAAGFGYPYHVPQGSVFILADYRTNAADSRAFGAIPVRQVRGKAIALLRRRGL